MSTEAYIDRGHKAINRRKVWHYLIWLILVMAVSVPVGIVIKTIPVDASTYPAITPPHLYSPADGSHINNNLFYLSFSGGAVTGGYNDYRDTLSLTVYYEVDNNYDFSSPEVTGSSWDFQPLGPLADGTYYWRVKACGWITRDQFDEVYNCSQWSAIWSFTIDTVSPAIPELVSPAMSAVTTDTTPTLDWNASSGASSYEWQVSEYLNFPSLYASGTTTSTSYTFTSPLPYDSYYWRVRAKDEAGNYSNWSTIRYFWAFSPPQLISPANDSFVSNLTPTINWSILPGYDMYYWLQVDNQSDFSSPNTNTGWITQTNYVTPTLREGITYYCRVRSHQGTDTSIWSPVWHFTTDTIPPPMPTLISPFNGAVTTYTQPTLDWNAVSGAASYEWQLSNFAAFTSNPFAYGTTTVTEYTFPSSLPYGTYYWRVRARDAAGNYSNWSAIWFFKVQYGTASPPWALQTGKGATGGGWYTLEDSSQVTFSFTVSKVPKTSDPVRYKGDLLLINEGKWMLKGSLESYFHDIYFGGWASGSGELYSWDGSLKEGRGGWVMAGNNIGYTIHFIDIDSSYKESWAIDEFGINISYFPEGEVALPNSNPMEIQGGNINIKDLNHNGKQGIS